MKIKEHKIQIQYSLAQFLYWVCSCLACGFAANFLQYKGLSNTMVGLVVGAYNVLTLAIQPLSAKIVTMPLTMPAFRC